MAAWFLCAALSELGQGAKTIMSQIVAEELRVPLDRVTIRPIDTAFTPFDRSTGSSRSTTVMGKAVELAGGDARRQIVELAMEHFECPEDAITLQRRRSHRRRQENQLWRIDQQALRRSGR